MEIVKRKLKTDTHSGKLFHFPAVSSRLQFMASLKNHQNHLQLLRFSFAPSSKLHYRRNPNFTLSWKSLVSGKFKVFRSNYSGRYSIDSLRCPCNPKAGTEHVLDQEQIERPPFDINLAVILAGFAFEAYWSPPVI